MSQRISSKGVTCLVFSKDSSIIISGSFDASLNLFGLKAGKLIKDLKRHSSFINDLQIDWDTDMFYSASSDGTVIYWDLKNQEMIRKITLPITQTMLDDPINNIIISRQNSTKGGHNLYVSNRSNSIYIMTSEGVVIKSFCTERNKYIIYSTLSNDENWLYVVDEDNCLYTFSINDSMIQNFFKIHEKDVIALIHHPNLPNVASYALDRNVIIYK
jgi:WD40 repeat-containing protein SMU1